MPRLTDVIRKIKVNGKTFNNPEWWSSKHKLGKVAKRNEFIANLKANTDLRASFHVNPLRQLSTDAYTETLRYDLDKPQYAEFAPWNPMFRKFRQIILFKK